MKNLHERGQTGAMGVSVGNASIVMVFAVVCLTLLAVMALLTSNREWKMAQHAAQSVTDYYAADTLAVEIYDEICTGQTGAASARAVALTIDSESASFLVAIDEGQSLAVQLQNGTDGWQVLRWQVQRNEQPLNEGTLNVWDGGEVDGAFWAGPMDEQRKDS